MLLQGISTLSSSLVNQENLLSNKAKIEQAQTEIATGRYADVNLQLGQSVSRNLDWRINLSQTQGFLDNNAQADAKANATQASLAAVKTLGNNFMNILTGVRGAQNGQTLIKQDAAYALGGLRDTVNTSYAGQFLMGGLNTADPPLKDYKGSTAEVAFDNAFQAQFGFAKTDPQAQNITPAQMTAFLSGPFDALFQGTNWNTNWSNATGSNLQTRIDSSQKIDIAANAGEPGFKNMLQGMIAVMDAGTGNLNQSTFQAVVDYALSKTGGAIQEIGETESRIGEGQQMISQTNEKLSAKKNLVQLQIQEIEGVNLTEISLRINQLMTQMEASYTVTGKLARLNLVSYL